MLRNEGFLHYYCCCTSIIHNRGDHILHTSEVFISVCSSFRRINYHDRGWFLHPCSLYVGRCHSLHHFGRHLYHQQTLFGAPVCGRISRGVTLEEVRKANTKQTQGGDIFFFAQQFYIHSFIPRCTYEKRGDQPIFLNESRDLYPLCF